MSGASGATIAAAAGAAPPGADPSALRDWQALRGAADIQYAPVSAPPPPKEPEWLRALLEALGRGLKAVFDPIGRALGLSWPVVQWILIGLAAAGALLVLWQLLAPLIAARRARPAAAKPDWAPSAADALALLEDADRLAAEGRFDEAAHLLLRRSVGQIAAARPDWLTPASTAREIAALPALPARAREAFAQIAARVERSLFALVPLGLADWQAARGAYAQFALAELSA